MLRAGPVSRRRTLRIAGALVLVSAVAVAGYAVLIPKSQADEAAPPPPTVAVTRGSMIAETNVPGTLQYATRRPITAGPAGVVTELPTPGAAIGVGGVLYRVDTRPVILLSGALPAWRDFATGMDDGEDVRQLEQNLLAFGVFDADPDTRFTWYTAEAIERWQAALGLEETGTLERAMIVFSDQDLRVDTVESRVGAEVGAGTALYQATGSRVVVDLNVKSSDRQLAVVGAATTVVLPDGTRIEGVVETVGAPVSTTTDNKSTVSLPVRVSLADQPAVAGLVLAPVTVAFASAMREDVLTVPVDALVPVDESRFAVEVPGSSADGKRSLLPVTVGAFASGMVEVSGTGIVEGLRVVVPAR